MTLLLCDTEKLSPVSKKKTNQTKTYTHTHTHWKNWSSYNGIISCCSLSGIIFLVFLCTGGFNY